ncbi:MAG: lamin tail domain-containing protein [Phycisphaerae bacterium]|nr:lamin tail domain-containing protein [Phycisphaerae bacterium]
MTVYGRCFLFVLALTVSVSVPFRAAHGAQADSVVVFNEIMYHPEVDEANLEWVELYNQMAVDLDLSGWSIRGGIDYDFPQGAIIRSNSYLVVAISPSALQSATGYADAFGPFQGRLANSGEELRLLNNNDRVMDIVFYQDDGAWPVAPDGSGVSLAKYDPLSTSPLTSNWRPSSAVGGTPGRINFPSSGTYVPEYDTFLGGADQAKVMIPSDDSAGTAWRQTDYDDSSILWASAVTGIGFDVNDSFLFNHARAKAVISGSGAYNNNPFNVPDGAGNFTALNVTDGSTSDIFGVNYWLGREGTVNEYFIVDLEISIEIKEIRLRNTHNTQYNDRGTADFEIWVSNEIDGNKQLIAPQRILSGTLTNVNGMSDIPADVFTGSQGLIQANARYVKFIALTANNSGNNVGLNEIEVYGSTIATDIEDLMSGKNATAYIRLPFNVSNPLRYDQLTLSMQYDDGFAAYLNGTKVEERNAPVAISWNASAVAARPNHEATVFESFDISQHLSLLRPGQNVLAIQGLNVSSSDGDFLICPKLRARRAEIAEYKSTLAINEIAAGDTNPFWVELYNYGPQSVNLQGFILESSGGPSTILSGTITAGEYIVIEMLEPDFVANTKDKLFLYTPDRLAVADAVVIEKRLRGHLPQSPLSPLQYPEQATPGMVNVFELHDQIVINEIMYHHRPAYEQSVPTEYKTTILVPFDAMWEYDQSGRNLGAGWKEPSADFSDWYDGLTWPTGPGVLGNETASLPRPIRTQLSLAGQTTYYFRTTFAADGDIQNVELQLNMLIDDGAVYYLNGQEIHRYNMDDGPVNHLTRANPGVANATLVGPVLIPVDLINGVNFLAVEVHQQTPTSSDIVFGLEASIYQAITHGQYIPFSENDQEWIELYNRSSVIVDLGGWRIDEAVEYEFPPDTTMAPGEYLVVANDASALRSLYPDIEIIGDYSGKLSNDNERIVLLDSNGNMADEVHYYGRGKWPEYADGGGSSLELIDPFADNSNPQAWAHSREQSRSQWKHYTYTAAASSPVYDPPIYFHEFVLGLLDSGEVLLDNISVLEDPDTNPIELVQNGGFQNDTIGLSPAKWRIQGTHDRSVVAGDPENAGNKVLHVIADGPSNYLSNHAETTLAGNRTVVNGKQYKISFDARWIAGSPQLRTELYYCDVPKTTIIETPRLSGTPGRQNSTYGPNMGPTFYDLKHEPLIPSSDDSVTVSVGAVDPDGISKVFLWYSVNGGSWIAKTMTAGLNNRYTASISPQNNQTVVQFYIAGRDALNAQTFFPADGPNSRALYKVDNGFSVDPLRRDFRFIMTPSDADFLHLDTNLLSNNRLGTTVVYDNREVFYNVGVRLKGSMFSRTNINGVGYNIRFHPDQPFRGAHETITLRANSRKELLPKLLINQSGGIPGMYDDIVKLTSPKGLGDGVVAMSMARYGDIFLESQYENGKDGTVFKMEGIRVMQATVNGHPESLKVYMPIGWMSHFDIADLGDDKELYRWAYRINRNRARDDYSRLMDMARMFSLTGTALREEAAKVLDMDVWMRQFALTSLCGIGDTYSQGNPHNLNFYVRPSDNKVLSMPWDWDFDFSQSVTAPLWGNQNISKIISLPPHRRLFLGHMHDMINTTYNTAYMTYWIDHYSQISGMNFSRVISYIAARSSYVLSQLPPERAFEITTNAGADFSVDDDGVVLEGSGWINVRNIYWNGSEKPLPVVWLDDETWQVVVPLEFGPNPLTLTAHDFQGNAIASQSITVTSTVEQRPLQRFLRVTELMYNPPGGSDYEFVELCNTGPVPLDLRDVAIRDAVEFAFASSQVTTLAPGEYVVIVSDIPSFRSRYGMDVHIAGAYTGKLANEGESLRITGKWDVEILGFAYNNARGWPLAANGAGHSMVPVDWVIAAGQTGLLDYGGNWRDSTCINGSPGKADPTPLPGVLLNELMAAGDDWVELYNATDTDIVLAAGHWHLSDDRNALQQWAIPETAIPARGRVSFADFGFGLSKAGEELFLSYLPGTAEDRVVDCVRFKAQEDYISLGRYPDGGAYWHAMIPSRNAANNSPLQRIVISELMYSPLDGASEYVELFNPTGQPIRLWDVQTGIGWRLTGGIDYVFPTDAVIPALGHLVVVPFVPDGESLGRFKTSYGDQASEILGPYVGRLSDVGERVALESPQADSAGQANSWVIVDEVIYFSKAPWVAGAAGSGRALWRIGVDAHGSDPAAWSMSSPKPGTVACDFDLNGRVDLADWARIAACWMTTFSDTDAYYEVNLDGPGSDIIDWSDMVRFLEHWLWSNR